MTDKEKLEKKIDDADYSRHREKVKVFYFLDILSALCMLILAFMIAFLPLSSMVSSVVLGNVEAGSLEIDCTNTGGLISLIGNFTKWDTLIAAYKEANIDYVFMTGLKFFDLVGSLILIVALVFIVIFFLARVVSTLKNFDNALNKKFLKISHKKADGIKILLSFATILVLIVFVVNCFLCAECTLLSSSNGYEIKNLALTTSQEESLLQAYLEAKSSENYGKYMWDALLIVGNNGIIFISLALIAIDFVLGIIKFVLKIRIKH